MLDVKALVDALLQYIQEDAPYGLERVMHTAQDAFVLWFSFGGRRLWTGLAAHQETVVYRR